MSDTETDLYLLRRELELERRAKELRKQNALVFFEPHEKQSLFFRNAFFHYRYARTGNRFGKSEMGAAEDISYALGYRPWIPKGVTFRTIGATENVPEEYWDCELRTIGIPNYPTKGLIITVDWDKAKEVFTELEGENKGKLIKYIPKNAFGTPTKNHSGAIDRIPVRHISGGWSIIHFDTVKSFKQDPMGQESSVWDWIHIDEPIPQGMWKAVARGLVDRKGYAWFTCTPIAEPWIDAMFIPDLETQMKEQVGTVADLDLSRWMMTGTMDDNPHNDPEAVRLYMSQLPEEEKEARRNGVPLAYSGLVYKEFSIHQHRLTSVPVGWTDWNHPPKNYCIRFAIDYHLRKPHAVFFVATSPQNIHYVFAEIWECLLMSELVVAIRNKLNGREATVPGLIDPLAKTPNQVTGITAIDELIRCGLPVMPAT